MADNKNDVFKKKAKENIFKSQDVINFHKKIGVLVNFP